MQPELFVGRSLSQVPSRRTKHSILIKVFSFFVATLLVLAMVPMPQAQAEEAGPLKLGSTGDAVKTLQSSLMKRGYLKSADGKFGKGTQTAVKLFQKHAGLTQDGVAGSGTLAKLYALLGSGKTNLTLKTGSKGNDVKVMQTRLCYLGYLDSSSITGFFGPATKTGVKKYQSHVGLSADGAAGPKTLVRLYTPNKGELVVKDAEKYLGCKYVYGASGPTTFDCSGLVYYVYKTYFGIILPRSAQGLASDKKYTITVETDGGASKARPGDILCFGDSIGSVGHVGIYIGNNQYIHAPETGDVVKITTLSRKVAVVKRVVPWG